MSHYDWEPCSRGSIEGVVIFRVVEFALEVRFTLYRGSEYGDETASNLLSKCNSRN